MSRKDDAGKPEMALLDDFGLALLAIGHVATFGAKKYSRGGWQTVPDALHRYKSAAERHRRLARYQENDPESGMPHRWHAAWNELCIVELEERAKLEEGNEGLDRKDG